MEFSPPYLHDNDQSCPPLGLIIASNEEDVGKESPGQNSIRSTFCYQNSDMESNSNNYVRGHLEGELLTNSQALSAVITNDVNYRCAVLNMKTTGRRRIMYTVYVCTMYCVLCVSNYMQIIKMMISINSSLWAPTGPRTVLGHYNKAAGQ